MTRAEALRVGTDRLAQAGIEQPRLEARWLLAHALGISQEALLANLRSPVPRALYEALLARRAGREPLAFITGEREFWSLPLAASPATVIPRADSETLIEAALAGVGARERVRRVLDLGTGTGNLVLAALTEFPAAFGVGVDIAPDAAALAARNAAAVGLARRAAFLAGDWAAAIVGDARGDGFDLVLSNPPYVERAAIAALMPEISRHEPARALDGGPDGLDAYRRIIPDLDRLLAPSGTAVLELGDGQADAVTALARAAGLGAIARSDLGGVKRALVLRRARP